MGKRQKKIPKHTIGASEVDLSHYVATRTADGRRTLDCDDAVARELRGATLDDIYRLAAVALKNAGKASGRVSAIERELRQRYTKLNPGLQRMSLGLRIRGARS